MNFEAIAQAAYQAFMEAKYADEMLGLLSCKHWNDLPEIERLAWKAAVIEAIDIHVAAVMA